MSDGRAGSWGLSQDAPLADLVPNSLGPDEAQGPLEGPPLRGEPVRGKKTGGGGCGVGAGGGQAAGSSVG